MPAVAWALVVAIGITKVFAFSPRTSKQWSRSTRRSIRVTFATSKIEEAASQPISSPTSSLDDLFSATINATLLRAADTTNQGHDSFRYEWGTWVDEDRLAYLVDITHRVQLRDSDLLDLEAQNVRLLQNGTDWACRLHVLPENTVWSGRYPTGSWTILKALTGLVEVCNLGNNGKPRGTVRKLRGAPQGVVVLGGATTVGDEPIKYVGGPLKRYRGAYGKTVLLEVTIRPPIGANGADSTGQGEEERMPIKQLDATLFLAEPEEKEEEASIDLVENESDVLTPRNASTVLASLSSTGVSSISGAVGGLDQQLADIARRVLASRVHPAATQRLGVSHVRGILLSGPPGCGKTLLARELARLLGAREPQIVNGPEILDKFIGEAEKKVRDLFAPAELEYAVSGDNSALHIIILDEMDAIARKRGTMTADTTGVRDSVVNQLLAKMDGVKQASNVLVVGLTNRPELLDPALLRPGRLEVQLRIELPDRTGRRDILRIHTETMKAAGGISPTAIAWIQDLGEKGLPAGTEHFSGAELAGLVRSAASFALARSLDIEGDTGEDGVVAVSDIEQALEEVRPALGKQDDVLKSRLPFGISAYSSSMKRILRDLGRFTVVPGVSKASSRLQSLLIAGASQSGGSGVTALSAFAASQASENGSFEYVRLVTALDLLSDGGNGEESRAAALVEKFAEARELSRSMLVLDDVDQLCAGSGAQGYSSVMVATLRALLRSPSPASSSRSTRGKTLHVIATTSRIDGACGTLNDLFEETIVVPPLQDPKAVATLLQDALGQSVGNPSALAEVMVEKLGGEVACKTALRLAERSVALATDEQEQLAALEVMLDDLVGDEVLAERVCRVT